MTQASWKRRGRARRIPRHPTRSSAAAPCSGLPAAGPAPAPSRAPFCCARWRPWVSSAEARVALLLLCLAQALPSQTFPPLSSPYGVSCWAFSWPSLLSGWLPTSASAGNCHEELRGCPRVPGTSRQDLAVPSTQPSGSYIHSKLSRMIYTARQGASIVAQQLRICLPKQEM